MENKDIVVWILSMILGCILILGIIGNVLCLIIWNSGKRSSKTACATYFKIIAALDLFNLVTNGPYKLLVHYSIRIDDYSNFLCKLYAFNEPFAFLVPAWMLIVLSFERMLSICFPFRFQLKGARKRAYITFVVLTLLVAAVVSRDMYIREIKTKYTISLDKNRSSVSNIRALTANEASNALTENKINTFRDNVALLYKEHVPTENTTTRLTTAVLKENFTSVFNENATDMFQQNVTYIFKENVTGMFKDHATNMSKENVTSVFKSTVTPVLKENLTNVFRKNVTEVFQKNATGVFKLNVTNAFMENVTSVHKENITDVLLEVVHRVFIRNETERFCNVDNEPYRYIRKIGIAWFFCIIPFILINICNISILLKLCWQRATRKTGQQQDRVSVFTKFCIAVGLLHCISTIPTAVINADVLELDLKLSWTNLMLLSEFASLCAFLNCSLDFVIYACMRGAFQTDLKELRCKCC